MGTAIWRTLIANRSAIGNTKRFSNMVLCTDEVPAQPIYGRMWDVLCGTSSIPENFFERQRETEENEKKRLFIEPLSKRVLLTLQGRSGFATKHGFIRIGPDTMRPGDVIAVLFGGKVPFVLRPQSDHYIFLGDCYVHGIINGELIELYMRKGEYMGGPVLKTFIIR